MNPERTVEHPVAEALQWLLKYYSNRLDQQRLLNIVDAKVSTLFVRILYENIVGKRLQ